MFKKIFKILYFLILPAGIFVLLGLAVDSNKSITSNEIHVNIDYSCGNHFISSEQIKSEIYNKIDTTDGKSLSEKSFRKIERIIDQMDFVKNSAVYRTVGGKIKADVNQRKPVARIVNNRGQSYYIDSGGKLMPLNKNYTIRTIVVSGNIELNYSPVLNLNDLSEDELKEADNLLMKDIFKIVNFIRNDNFWNAIIDHIYVSSSREFELIPKNGAHIIEFGNIDRMEQKFNKLYVFYNYGLTKTGWNKYNRINLKYKNQVVCAK